MVRMVPSQTLLSGTTRFWDWVSEAMTDDTEVFPQKYAVCHYRLYTGYTIYMHGNTEPLLQWNNQTNKQKHFASRLVACGTKEFDASNWQLHCFIPHRDVSEWNCLRWRQKPACCIWFKAGSQLKPIWDVVNLKAPFGTRPVSQTIGNSWISSLMISVRVPVIDFTYC